MLMTRLTMKILAVDDDPDFLLLLHAVLRDLGYDDVNTAISGPHALEVVMSERTPFDCFILDIQMPGMNGVELTREIRSLPHYAATPIMMNTVMTDRSWIEAAFDAGANDYLTKPIDKFEIRTRMGVIDQLVEEKRRRESERAAQQEVLTVDQPSYGFLDGIPMQNVAGSMDLLSMQNYLKALGPFRALSVVAVAVHATNAREIYDMEGGYVFGEVMVDLAHCIPECFRGDQFRLAYCGGGTFVCLLPLSDFNGAENLSDRLQEVLQDFESIYDVLDYRAPQVTVGSPARVGLGGIRSPQRVIDAAIAQKDAGVTRAVGVI
jgi:CheY-like chemotaxis protein